jgi:hypothetical protein
MLRTHGCTTCRGGNHLQALLLQACQADAEMIEEV